MAITQSDIVFRLSGGSANASAVASLGGAKSSAPVPAAHFDDVSSAEAAVGDVEYRCFYVHNGHATLTLQNAVAWVQPNTPSTSSGISIGLGSSAVNGTEQTVASEGAAPSGVSFSEPSSKAAGIALGSIPPGQHRAIWLRRTISAAAPAGADTYQIQVEGDTAA